MICPRSSSTWVESLKLESKPLAPVQAWNSDRGMDYLGCDAYISLRAFYAQMKD